MSLRLGVIGLDHLHVFELVQGLLDAGANAATHVADEEFLELYEGWRPDSVAVHPAELLADDRIDVVVTAGIPSQRADVAVAALSAGKHVLSAKPGVTTAPDLQAFAGRWPPPGVAGACCSPSGSPTAPPPRRSDWPAAAPSAKSPT